MTEEDIVANSTSFEDTLDDLVGRPADTSETVDEAHATLAEEVRKLCDTINAECDEKLRKIDEVLRERLNDFDNQESGLKTRAAPLRTNKQELERQLEAVRQQLEPLEQTLATIVASRTASRAKCDEAKERIERERRKLLDTVAAYKAGKEEEIDTRHTPATARGRVTRAGVRAARSLRESGLLDEDGLTDEERTAREARRDRAFARGVESVSGRRHQVRVGGQRGRGASRGQRPRWRVAVRLGALGGVAVLVAAFVPQVGSAAGGAYAWMTSWGNEEEPQWSPAVAAYKDDIDRICDESDNSGRYACSNRNLLMALIQVGSGGQPRFNEGKGDEALKGLIPVNVPGAEPGDPTVVTGPRIAAKLSAIKDYDAFKPDHSIRVGIGIVQVAHDFVTKDTANLARYAKSASNINDWCRKEGTEEQTGEPAKIYDIVVAGWGNESCQFTGKITLLASRKGG